MDKPVKSGFRLKNITYGGLLCAAGVLLPQLFHLIGGAELGAVFLPIHIMTITAGFLLGPLTGAMSGLIVPAASFIFYSMPPAARLPLMMIELAAYGAAAGVSERLLGFIKPAWPRLLVSLVFTQIAGRAANALCLIIGANILRLNLQPPAAILTAAATGLPGILMQWALIPPLVLTLRRFTGGRFIKPRDNGTR